MPTPAQAQDKFQQDVAQIVEKVQSKSVEKLKGQIYIIVGLLAITGIGAGISAGFVLNQYRLDAVEKVDIRQGEQIQSNTDLIYKLVDEMKVERAKDREMLIRIEEQIQLLNKER